MYKMYYFYTSPAQERKLCEQYEALVAQKQAEIDEQRKKGKIVKYTARAYIHKPQSIFLVRGEDIYLGEIGEKYRCPTEAEGEGEIYSLDMEFKEQIDAFLDEKKDYNVIFSPSGKYGPTIDYCGKKYEMPAVIKTMEGYSLEVEDEEKYSLGVF